MASLGVSAANRCTPASPEPLRRLITLGPTAKPTGGAIADGLKPGRLLPTRKASSLSSHVL